MKTDFEKYVDDFISFFLGFNIIFSTGIFIFLLFISINIFPFLSGRDIIFPFSLISGILTDNPISIFSKSIELILTD